MSNPHPLAAWLRLTLTPGVGAGSQRQLLAAFGLPENIYAAGHSALAAVVGSPIARTVLEHDTAAAVDGALAWADEPGNSVITLGDPLYPAALLEIPDPPVLLYVKGEPALLSRQSIAVVGATGAGGRNLAGVFGSIAGAFGGSNAQVGLANALPGDALDNLFAATGNFAAHRFYEHMDFTPRPVTGMRFLQAIA